MTFGLFYRLTQFHLIALVAMSLFRIVFLFYYGGVEKVELYPLQTLNALFFGLRLDLTVIGYIQAVLTLILIFSKELFLPRLIPFFKIYLFLTYTIVSLILFADFAFYSFFKEHINLLFFGLFDDDTWAILETIWKNYPVIWILLFWTIYLYLLWKTIAKLFSDIPRFSAPIFPIATYLAILFLNFLAIRGTLAMYPLGKMMPNISEDRFIDTLSYNGVRSFIYAFKHWQKSKTEEIDLIAKFGYSNNIEEAFKIHTGKEKLDTPLLQNITYKTSKKEYLEKNPPNVVVIVVESFGLPPIQFQSEDFNIMGSLKKHFDEDFLFKNFISSSNGTIYSLEALMLNIPRIPGTLPFVETKHSRTSYLFAPSFVYKRYGYETTFIYGGDLSWRDIGGFAKVQGFDNVVGKFEIHKTAVENFGEDRDYYHPWGIHDEYLYHYIFRKLEKSKKPQFILAMTTDNHPPYTLPKEYQPLQLEFSKELLWSITGDLKLAKERFLSFQYALNSLGNFLDKLKGSPLGDRTIVVVTADNHTADGIMRYRDEEVLNSKRIPFYLYLPKYIRDEVGDIDTSVFGSHKDIFPTLYNLTLSDTKYIAVGTDLRNPQQLHIGFNDSMVLVSKNRRVRLKSFDSNLSIAKYYKATLAITQYLLNQY